MLLSAETTQAQDTNAEAPLETPAELDSSTPTAAASPPTDKELKFGGESFPLRRGFSVVLGGGVGVKYGDPQEQFWGPSLFNVGLGGFFSESLALFGQATILVISSANGSSLLWFGPQLQFWPTDRLAFEVGVGFVRADPMNNGIGLTLKAGYSLWLGERHTIRIAMNAMPALMGPGFQYGHLFLVEWQSH